MFAKEINMLQHKAKINENKYARWIVIILCAEALIWKAGELLGWW
jgi:hypothetical protein